MICISYTDGKWILSNKKNKVSKYIHSTQDFADGLTHNVYRHTAIKVTIHFNPLKHEDFFAQFGESTASIALVRFVSRGNTWDAMFMNDTADKFCGIMPLSNTPFSDVENMFFSLGKHGIRVDAIRAFPIFVK